MRFAMDVEDIAHNDFMHNGARAVVSRRYPGGKSLVQINAKLPFRKKNVKKIAGFPLHCEAGYGIINC